MKATSEEISIAPFTPGPFFIGSRKERRAFTRSHRLQIPRQRTNGCKGCGRGLSIVRIGHNKQHLPLYGVTCRPCGISSQLELEAA